MIHESKFARLRALNLFLTLVCQVLFFNVPGATRASPATRATIMLAPSSRPEFLAAFGFGSRSSLSCLLLAFAPNSWPLSVLGLARRYHACS